MLFHINESPDGTKIISGGKDKTARVWDPQTGNCIATLTGHSETVLGVAFVDNETAATCSQDGTIRVWDVKSGNCNFIVKPDGNALCCCNSFPERNIVAVGSSEGFIFLVDGKKGVLLKSIFGHKSAVCIYLDSSFFLRYQHFLFCHGCLC